MFGFGTSAAVTRATGSSAPGLQNGTNLGLMESVTYNQYDPASGPPTSNYPIFTDTLLDYLQSSGVKSIRFTFSWEALQSSLGGSFPILDGGNYQAYYVAYANTVQRLLARNINVIVALWGFSVASGGVDIAYQGGTFTPSDFGQFWGIWANAVKTFTGNDQRISFDLVNEPHSGTIVAGTSISQFTPYYQAAINAIRANSIHNRIWIQGWNYSNSFLYTTNGSSTEFLKLSDSANNIGVALHNYDGQGVGVFGGNPANRNATTALRDSMAPTVAWARANGNIPLRCDEMAIDAGAPTGTLAIAQAQWADWQAYCIANKDIIQGWNWWAVSEYNWWNTGDSQNGQHWGLVNGSDTTPSLYMNLIQTTLGNF